MSPTLATFGTHKSSNDNDKVTYFKVTDVNVCAERNGNDTVITIKYKGENVGYHTEKQCFGSKEELINSLI